ncbi:MAG: TIR domain-containing protein [bacterium]|nr:TIR domain-containing protein [bacterium]
MGNLFISYAREDLEIARRLYRDLKNLGYPAWIDTEDLLPGQRWKDSIQDAPSAFSS